jgi:lipid A 3-O-deacylase
VQALAKAIVFPLFATLLLIGAPRAAIADDPDFISFSAGWFDFNRQKDQGAEFRLEYRSDFTFLFLKPFVALAGASSGHGFVGAGVLFDTYWGKRVVTTLSFAPHVYIGGDSDLDLGHTVEFRSQAEIAYRFDDRSRLGLAISHYSNASLGSSNPGTETLSLYYSIPFSNIGSYFD